MITHLINEGKLIPKENWRQLLWRYSPEYLESALDERIWNGKVSVTTCLRCPREYFLRQKFPYAMDPNDYAFAILGTKVHKGLESKNETIITELASGIELEVDMTGIMDVVFAHNREITLGDNKTWGSYAVAKNMGLREEMRPKMDDHGLPVYYKRKSKYGNVGDPMMEKHFTPDSSLAENHDVTMQLNMYRMMLEQELEKGTVVISGAEGKKKVTTLRVYCIVRDGNTVVAKGRGILSATYTIPIKILPDEEVIEFFEPRAAYIKAVFDKHAYSSLRDILKDPPHCGNKEETYNGWMCKNTCPVSHLCRLCATHPYEAERETPYGRLLDINTGGLRNEESI